MDSTRKLSTVALQGQGATEYLVVLSVVLIIGLVSVSLLSYFPGTAKDTSSNAAKTYWQGAARPLHVVESTQTGSSTYSLVLENAEADPLRLTGISFGGAAALFSESGSTASNASDIYFAGGERKVINVSGDLGVSGEAGQTVGVDIKFTYVSSHGITGSQSGEQTLPILLTQGVSSSGSCPARGGGGTLHFVPELPFDDGCTALAPGRVGQPYSAQLCATGASEPYGWVNEDDFLSSVGLQVSDGIISGSPVWSSGHKEFGITVFYEAPPGQPSQSATQCFSIEVS